MAARNLHIDLRSACDAGIPLHKVCAGAAAHLYIRADARHGADAGNRLTHSHIWSGTCDVWYRAPSIQFLRPATTVGVWHAILARSHLGTRNDGGRDPGNR